MADVNPTFPQLIAAVAVSLGIIFGAVLGIVWLSLDYEYDYRLQRPECSDPPAG